ncbi:GNAT family N-acetyltransferase [Brevundimonas fluminis]|uniref:GNAT family N-acetyltransferase n=1 Tax=Brevundimonas fluminis TaxID=2487274 RepID=UPI000F6568A2|nr:GNAT family protein [Brevundimonas fluminis]
MNLVPAVLENRFVRLEPLDDGHREPLRAACDADPELWPALYYNSFGGEHFDGGWAMLRDQQASGRRLPFAVIRGGEVVGMSSFIDIQPANRAVEIGTTYYRPDMRGGPVNPATKRLMLEHAHACGVDRVAFKVDDRNLRSQAAMTKLGAVREGVLRHDLITWTGHVRSSVVFSVLADEWPVVRARLDERLEGFGETRAT